jgi:hypothetical protein
MFTTALRVLLNRPPLMALSRLGSECQWSIPQLRRIDRRFTIQAGFGVFPFLPLDADIGYCPGAVSVESGIAQTSSL